MFRQCTLLGDYIWQGLCIHDATNQICMPDVTIISTQTMPGWNMKERINNWHKSHLSPAIQAQANIIEVSTAEPLATSVPATPNNSTVSYTTSFTTQNEEELARVEAVTLANLKHWKEIKKYISTAGKAKNLQNTSPTPSSHSPSQPTSTAKSPPTKAPTINSTVHQL